MHAYVYPRYKSEEMPTEANADKDLMNDIIEELEHDRELTERCPSIHQLNEEIYTNQA